MQNVRLRKVLEITAVIIFFSAFVLSLSRPLVDPDVFWHLKTGEWIWENKSLPDKDPFSFSVEPYQYKTSVSTSFPLKQYWLAQLLMYGFYNVCGFYGIIVFRCLIYLGTGLVLYHWMGRKGISRTGRLAFLIPVVYLSAQWLGERPNNLSFLFSVTVVYLLENPPIPPLLKGGKGGLLKLIALPMIMLLWANMHGGFILGDAIIAIYIFSEISMFYYRKIGHVEQPADRSSTFSLNHFIMICIISMGISFINPNTYKVIYMISGVTSGEYLKMPITEFLSPFYYAKRGIYKYLIYIGFIAVIFIPRIRQFKFNSALLVFFLISLSLKSIRYIPFLIITIPFMAGAWGGLLDKWLKKVEKTNIMMILVIVISTFLAFNNLKYTVLKKDVVSPFYPAGAIKFIKAEKPEGEIFNELSFGGYIIWSLYPDYKVFIDGRRLFQTMELSYIEAISGRSTEINGTPVWKAVLSAYRINTVLVFGVNVIDSGFTRLVRRLIDDKEWHLVLIDQEALLFLRETEKNREIIRKHSKPKILAYGKALEQAEIYRFRYPNDWRAYTTLGEINLCMGKPGVALSHFETAIRLNPSLKSTLLVKLAEELKTGRDYTRMMDEIFR